VGTSSRATTGMGPLCVVVCLSWQADGLDVVVDASTCYSYVIYQFKSRDCNVRFQCRAAECVALSTLDQLDLTDSTCTLESIDVLSNH
jgi:hypothetical protein